MHFRGKVTVKFKKSVLEPQGKAIELSLSEKGHRDIDLVRVGKYIEVDLQAESESEAEEKLKVIAEDLLYNPVMEVYELEVVKL